MRLRHLERRRRRGADLPDQLARASASGWPGNSESVAIVCEDAAQVAKIVEVRDNLPDAAPRDRGRPVRRRRRRHRARRPARARARPRRGRARARAPRPSSPTTPYTIIYTSGTTGPPKGCVLSHRNYRQVVNMCEEEGVVEAGDVVYLFLPLAHAYALLIQLLADRPRRRDRLLGRRPEADRARADGGPPDLPAVGAADLREDLHARHLQRRPRADQGRRRRRAQGARAAGRRPGGPRRAAGRTTTQADEAAVQERPQRVRRPAQAGQHRRRADRQGDPRVLLRLRRAGDGGLRDDGDRHGRHDLDGRATTGSARSAAAARAARSRSPTTARS